MILEGMYVRCPIDKEYPENPRVFALGKVINVNSYSQEVVVSFYDPYDLKNVYGVPNVETYSIDKVSHVKIQLQASVYIKSLAQNGEIIDLSSMNKEHYSYYVQSKQNGHVTVSLVREDDLLIPFNYSYHSPIEQLKAYEFHNPIWYNHRKIVSKSVHTLKNATYGFETLLGSRVFLLTHQVDTIVRAIVENPCRLMLADEVGLGKTIQSIVIKKGLQKRLGQLRTLIIAPESLVYQWKNELAYKFWEDVPVWSEENRFYEEQDQIIFPIEKLNTSSGKRLLQQNWGLCIVDETHQFLKLEAEYKILFNLSQKVKHILLLTATPIQSRRTEYLKLLLLLEPQKYAVMSEHEFNQLLDKQSYLSGKIHALVRDLPEYEVDELADDYVDELEEIANNLQDSLLKKLVSGIDVDSDDEGLEAVRLALAYIGEHYQIERKIIRHRRKELADKLASRSLETVSYPMMGAEVTFYEVDMYAKLLEYLQQFSAVEQEEQFITYSRSFLSSMFSSPWALENLLKTRKEILKMKKSSVKVKVSTIHQVLQEVTPILNELETLNELLLLCQEWKSGVLDEFNRIEELNDDPDQIKGRLMKVIDYVSQSIDEKYVIFSSWKETVLALEKVFVDQFGKECVRSFYKGMSDDELQLSVDDFQRDKNCRFIICDELGGEGRNFQIADELIHIDLPWSPTILEQRIGRLDRIGREKEVRSVVFFSEETLEEDLFHLWDKGLEIFSESLSGLEIAIGGIHDQIGKSLVSNLRYGLSDVLLEMSESLQEMRKKVEEERYFDMARQLDKHVEEQLINLIEEFDGENGKKLHNTMMSWSHLTGLNGLSNKNGDIIIFPKERASINSMKRTMLIPPNMDEIHKRAKNNTDLRGTFLRKMAVEREDLIFYAPGDPFFDAIVNNAFGSELGRSTAYYQKNSKMLWRGFVFTWNVTIDPIPLIKKGYPIENLVLAQGYIPLDPIITFQGLTDKDREVDETLVQEEFWRPYQKSDTVHLGKRDNQTIDYFKTKFPKEDWLQRIETAFEESSRFVSETVPNRIDTKRAINDFQHRIDGLRASNLFYNRMDIENTNEIDRWKGIFSALQQGLESPKITLDSVAFVWMVENNG